jgi:fructokinase
MEYTIVGLGEILWDLLPSGKKMGGAPANFAYHAQELGKAVSAVVSCIGNDIFGKEILTRFNSLSLNNEYLAVDKKHPTGTVSVEFDHQGNHAFIIREDVAWDYIPESPSLKKLADKTDAVCFGSLAQRSPVSRNTIQSFLSCIPSQALCIFDINLRQSFYSKEIIETSLNFANIFKVNEDELPTVASLLSINGSETAILKEIAQHYDLRLIVLTKGKRGSTLYAHELKKMSYHNGYNVNVKDTVGSGDAFTASVAVGLLKGYDLDYVNDCANRVATFVCTQAGATPQLTDEIKKLFIE